MILIVHEFSYLKSSISIQSSFKYLSCQWCLYYGIPLAYVFACMGTILQNISVSLRKVDIVGNIFERKKNVFAPFIHTMWKNEKFYLTEKKFREFNSLVRLLLSRKFCQKSVRENFRNFLTVIYQPTNATDLFFAQSCHLCSTSSPECKIKLLLCSLTENGITENKGKKCVLLVAKIKVFSNGKNSSNYTTMCRSFWLVRHISLLSRNTGGDKMETG